MTSPGTSDHDPELVKRIADQVIRALQAGQSRPEDPASIKPPIGVCTGDYTQFTDRPDLAVGALNESSGDVKPPVVPGGPALSGIVTAQQLQEAIDASPEGVALLAHDARLTPLANDFARERPEKVRRGDASATGRPSPASSGVDNSPPWLWWAEGHCPAVIEAAKQLGGQVLASAAARSDAGMLQAVRDIAAGVRGQTLNGGLLFVRSAARAAVLANRCPHLRAIVGTCPEAVEQGIAQIGANVLIVEYPYVAPDRIVTMSARVVRSRPGVSPHTERELADLHRNG